MKKFIVGFLLGSLLFGTTIYAYRAPKPTPLRLPLDDNQITELNNSLENLWNITNGRYVNDVVSTVPTASADEGTTKIYSSGGVYRIYIYLNGGWRIWSSD